MRQGLVLHARLTAIPHRRFAAAASLIVLLFLVTGSASARTLDGTHILAITYTSNATWTLAGSPFIVDGDVQVASGATLTIEPGVVIKFNGTFRTLRVNGTLKAIGTAADPITFTSIQDDTIAGDSGADGPTSGAPGQWYAIEIPAGTQTEFRNVEIRYGGYGSADVNYGAISISGATTSVLIDQSDIHDNQRSGIKTYLGGVSISDSTISSNGNGISVNGGWATLTNRTVVSMNTSDGVWFNYLNSYTGPTSAIYDSDVLGNGRYGINLQVDRTLATSYWPHGNRNNIYDSGSMQLYLGGYHPASTPQYNVDWTGNYWGSDVYYWNAPSACSTTAPNSPGHLAYQGNGGNPPAGPISASTYLAGTVYCSYDRFLISGSGFNSGYSQPDPQLTPEQHATVVSIAEDDPRVTELLGGRDYAVTSVVPWARIRTDHLIGADITFSWTDPVTLSYDWPSIAYDDFEVMNPPYEESTTQYTASGAKSIDVLVDLTRGLVVSIEPGVEATLTGGGQLEALRARPSKLGRRADPALDRSAGGGIHTLAEDEVDSRVGTPTTRLRKFCISGDCFWNYDFTTKRLRSDKTDWPVDMIFWNNAWINKVKDQLGVQGFSYWGTTMHALLNDGVGWGWDSDKGVKDHPCPLFTSGPARHVRLYADDDDRLYNAAWGFYVIATAHFDNNECTIFGWGKWSGKSEKVEQSIADQITDSIVDDWDVQREAVNMYNQESGDRGRHRKLNSGYATKFLVP